MNLTDEYFLRNLTNKKVALVGGAKVRASDEVLKEYDCVVGINYKPKMESCDGLFCRSTLPTKRRQYPGKWFASFTPDRSLQERGIYYLPYGKGDKWFSVVCKRTPFMPPLTGILAICSLVRFPLKELFVTGYDFYQFDRERPESSPQSVRNCRANMEILRDLMLIYKQYDILDVPCYVRLDERLKNVLKENEILPTWTD